MAPTRRSILTCSAHLTILQTFLQLDVRFLPSVDDHFLQIVDDKVSVLLLPDVETFSLGCHVPTVRCVFTATARVGILRRKGRWFQ